MKNRFYLIVAVFLCLAAALLIFKRIAPLSKNETTTQNKNPSHNSSPQTTPQSPSDPDSKAPTKSGKPRKGVTSINSVERLREIGYYIVADRIDEYSAEGSLRIIAPDGNEIIGNKLSFSPKDELFFVTGSVELIPAKDEGKSSWKSTSDQSRLEIDPIKGSYTTDSGSWSLGPRKVRR